ncbi:SigE family RNA polymerase sigma factor [Catellatospora tritici]|uniref:SigE family RNA polymerase sigma factor n=1 Tax=Catellatospora tritici TaxID=2851566 RepID=UPI001C2DCBA6|nr:SigE family RNA polymerase sigma factor [Catellatospora tritici]MBV1851569.1 SigE family RNA polymerase sigma factor [Catellatospora tritici]
MAEKAEFDEFVLARSHGLLRTAYALTRDHGHAEDLLQTALVRSWSAWRRIEGDPEPYVRAILANTYNSWWRRRWHGERPTEVLPETVGGAPQDRLAERDGVWQALGRLSRQQRTVLVLRYFEDLSEADIAAALGISAGAVKSHAAKGLARLRLDPTLLPVPIDDAPAGNERLAGVRARVRQRRNGRLATAAAATLVIAVVLGLMLIPGVRRHSLPDPAVSRSTGAPDRDGAVYVDGNRVVAHESQPYALGDTMRFTWTPADADPVIVYGACDHAPAADALTMTARVDGVQVFQVRCTTESWSGAYSTDRVKLSSLTLRPGEPVEVTVKLVLEKPWTTLDRLGKMEVGIGEPVPFEQYPLPSRPPALEPLIRDPADAPPQAVILDQGTNRQVKLQWTGGLQIIGRSQTPGVLRISVNGGPVQDMNWWDYDQRTLSYYVGGPNDFPSISPEDQVTVSIEPLHTTGDWFVAIVQAWG